MSRHNFHMPTRAFVCLLLTASIGAAQGDPENDSLSAAAEIRESSPMPREPGSLDRVLDSFLRAYAGDNLAWRSNVNTGGVSETSPLAPGYQRGRTRAGNWFSYRPKTSAGLSVEERRSVMRDRRFAPFLAQMRELADGLTPPPAPELADGEKPEAPSVAPAVVARAELMAKLMAARRPPPAPVTFEISPEELMLPGPLVIVSPGL